MTEARASRTRTRPVQRVAALVGAVFLVVGVLGFIPGVTTNYDQLEWAGPDADAMLFGVFAVSILHNLVHLAFGVLGLAAAMSAAMSRIFLLVGGLVYLILTAYGVWVDLSSDANFIPVNTPDNWLHLGLGVGMIAAALVATAIERRRIG
ncbi:uncharacterized protein DUF4383 [Prauserella shujinwangii]|uniref:Uncharacterized protein DUF4383 n=1 Tax=Prauserella shujinwangii TaxID=1453103 RepID=A0A2T0LN19_9PSEU|nr:DUF4383 domain-containing protein [Prauserella shujinwangii]PRX44592.1 uncharacterized protein DUF4383 [Prauserella shujinwangii]